MRRGGVEERVEGSVISSLNRLRFLRMGTIIAMFDHLLWSCGGGGGSGAPKRRLAVPGILYDAF